VTHDLVEQTTTEYRQLLAAALLRSLAGSGRVRCQPFLVMADRGGSDASLAHTHSKLSR
jgi:hypothetical protein